MMVNKKKRDPALLGLDIAELLTENYDDTLIYEKAASYLFENLSYIVDQLRYYVLDNYRENFKEEVIVNDSGRRPGYDLIPFYQLPDIISRENDVFRFENKGKLLLLVPLINNNNILGLLELRLRENIEDSLLDKIRKMARAVALGLSNIFFKTDTLTIKKNTDISIEINRELQSINKMDTLIVNFMEKVITEFRFDRITTFLINDKKKIIYARGINEKKEIYSVDDYPELPDFSSDYIELENTLGYWFPLKTNTATVGVVLFDNIYTLYNISDIQLNTLRILCSQFASSIDNLRLFSDLQESAFFDTLTGLHNRTYLDKVSNEYKKEKYLPLSVIVGDVNGLKITNDVFGHQSGDELLKRIAGILKDSCSEKDLVVRWGGDEFFILLPGQGKEEVSQMCNDIKLRCQNRKHKSDLQLSISLGYATREDTSTNMNRVVKEAEDRMYRHKLLETRSFRNSLLESLKETLVEKCNETAGHSDRMSRLAEKMGIHMGLLGSELDDLKLLAMLHDIGKVVVEDSILNKPGPLNESEWKEIFKHSEAGYRIAQASSELSQIANYILYHHEKWDGSGYPLGKKGKEIPLLSRIITVIDSYDVMRHKRPYKEAMSHEEAVAELRENAGSQFDPEIVEIFCSMEFEEF